MQKRIGSSTTTVDCANPVAPPWCTLIVPEQVRADTPKRDRFGDGEPL